MSTSSRRDWRTTLTDGADDRRVREWLQDRGSLTERLESTGKFRVKVLRQQLARPTPDEAAEMRLARKRLVWVREVLLHCDDVPVVFAHSVLNTRPRGPMTRWFRRLGNRSLGALLFAHAGFCRSTIQYRQIDHRHPLFAAAIASMQLPGKPPVRLWARRSGFSFAFQSVLVTEIFAPLLYSK